MMQKLKYLIIVYLLSSVQILTGQESEEYQYLMLFSNILNHIKSNYMEEIPSEELFKGAISGVFQQLDPHTIYLSQERLNRFMQISEGSASGVGIEFEIINSEPTVISVIKDSPADDRNIRTGDVLIEINSDKLPENISTADLMLLLYGESDTKVNLKFKRGKSSFDVSLKRDVLEFSSIPISIMLERGIGYIKCTNFSQTTTKDIHTALKKLDKEDINGLILDLRDNPGGILKSAIETADLFLPPAKKILYTTGRKEVLIQDFYTEDKINFEMPMVILMNNGSASAAEVLAGALQDNGRAKILGAPSFGKGLIQSTFLLENGGAILMTIGEYRTPSGKKIQREYKDLSFEEYYNNSRSDTINKAGGIQPDIVQAASPITDSVLYSSTCNNFITKKAVSFIQDSQLVAKYNNFVAFKNGFNEHEIDFPAVDSVNAEYNKSIRIYIKSRIAGMRWGPEAELECGKSLDVQLLAASDYLKKLQDHEKVN